MALKTGALGSKQSEYVKRVGGLATIKVGEKFCFVKFEDSNVKFADGSSAKKIPLSELPKFPKLQVTPQGQEPPHYRVRLNPDATEIESITPASGKFSAKLFDFGRQSPDVDPVPYEKRYKDEKPYMAFNALFKITKGAMKGAIVSYFLHYKFDEDNGNTTFVGNPDNPKATRLVQLIKFCNALGMIDDVIPWPEDGNVLPTLLERGLEADREVQILIQDGYMSEIIEEENYGDAEPPDEPEPVKDIVVTPDAENLDDDVPAKADNEEDDL